MGITAETIADLLAASPPRRVPPAVKRAVHGARSWFLPLFGLAFGGFGIVFAGIFFPWNFRSEWRLRSGSARAAPGEIVAVSETNLSINHTRVFAYDFRFQTEAGRRLVARCFTTGRRWEPGAAVAVSYLPDRPEIACPAGARLSEGGWGAAFVLIFPAVGFGLVGWFVWDRRKKMWLLRHGAVAEVNIVSVDETNQRVNYQSVWRIVVSSPVPGGPPVTVRRVNRAEVNLALGRARDGRPVFVLHDPQRPQRLLFPEAWIGG